MSGRDAVISLRRSLLRHRCPKAYLMLTFVRNCKLGWASGRGQHAGAFMPDSHQVIARWNAANRKAALGIGDRKVGCVHHTNVTFGIRAKRTSDRAGIRHLECYFLLRAFPDIVIEDEDGGDAVAVGAADPSQYQLFR